MTDRSDDGPPREVGMPPDGALHLRVAPRLGPLVAGWVPLLRASGRAQPAALIDVGEKDDDALAGARAGAFDREPDSQIDGVRLWLERDGAIAAGAATGGVIDLKGRRARLFSISFAPEPAATELFWLLTISAALLFGRLGRALVHAGAILDAGGRAYLLVGHGGSGKTTACANLMRAGWRCLADDHVVLFRGEGGGEILAAGLPRPFGLDAGWPDRPNRGQKRRVHPRDIAPDSLVTSAPLGGVLLPAVDPGGPTETRAAGSGETLGHLLRQSPWLSMDPPAARPILDLLSAACRLPCAHLRLGPDSFADGAPVANALGSFGAVRA